VNALANPEVGKYLNASFVSTYQKVGTFTLNGGQKQGGNVASYFCTPDGRVLHAVAGPVKARVLLREARWATDIAKLALLDNPKDDLQLRTFFWNAHAQRLLQEHGLDLTGAGGRSSRDLNTQGRVHLILTAAPLAPIDRVYKLVFEKVLGEKVSTAPVVQVGG
jgi:hypothetical protein